MRLARPYPNTLPVWAEAGMWRVAETPFVVFRPLGGTARLPRHWRISSTVDGSLLPQDRHQLGQWLVANNLDGRFETRRDALAALACVLAQETPCA